MFGETEKEHAGLFIKEPHRYKLYLDNDSYGICQCTHDPDEEDVEWFYDCLPDKLFRAVLDQLEISHEEM